MKLKTDSMPKKRLSRWPRKTAVTTCLAFICLWLFTLMLYRRGDFALEPDEFEQNHLSVTQQLADITKTFSSNSTVGLVLAATQSEDLTWLLEYCRDQDAIPFIYSTDPKPAKHLLIPKTTRGREAAAYLSYVVDFYYQLPPYSIFIHSNKEQWHNDLFGPETSVALRNLRLEAVAAQGYVNLRCSHNEGCLSVNPWEPTQIDIEKKDIRAYFPQVYQTLFGVGPEQVPEHIGNVCCGQFAVSRETIRRRPRRDYERMLAWAKDTDLTDSFGVGWVFEKVWHVVFGMPDIYCPRFEQCRCDVYGWCGPLADGETLVAIRVQT